MIVHCVASTFSHQVLHRLKQQPFVVPLNAVRHSVQLAVAHRVEVLQRQRVHLAHVEVLEELVAHVHDGLVFGVEADGVAALGELRVGHVVRQRGIEHVDPRVQQRREARVVQVLREAQNQSLGDRVPLRVRHLHLALRDQRAPALAVLDPEWRKICNPWPGFARFARFARQ